jgi:hypothetical protein
MMVLDLGADFLHGENGDFLAPMPVSHTSQTNLSSLAPNGDDFTDSTHECFCCCSHLEQEGSRTIHVALKSTQNLTLTSGVLPEPEPVFIYHPPQQLV